MCCRADISNDSRNGNKTLPWPGKKQLQDPYADSDELNHEYGFSLVKNIAHDYDAVIIPVPHKDFLSLDDAYFCSITKPQGMIADLKGIYRGRIINRNYWSL